MTRFFALAFAFCCTIAHAQPIVQVSTDQASYEAGEDATVRYRLVATPESPSFEFFLSATLNGSPISISKITETEFYSRLTDLTAGTKTISLTVFMQDRALAKALVEAVQKHDSEIQRINDALPGADPADVPALEAELALHQARRADALAKLSSIRRHIDGPRTTQFVVN